jgi:hypothetical protein
MGTISVGMLEEGAGILWVVHYVISIIDVSIFEGTKFCTTAAVDTDGDVEAAAAGNTFLRNCPIDFIAQHSELFPLETVS